MTTDPKAVVPWLCSGRHASGQQRRAAGWVLYLCVLLAPLAAIVSSQPIAVAQTTEVRRILILNEVNTSYPGIRTVNDGIQAALNDSPYRLQLYSEYMDTSLFPDPAAQQEFRAFYIRKYQNRKPDVIITVGPSPLQLWRRCTKECFPVFRSFSVCLMELCQALPH